MTNPLEQSPDRKSESAPCSKCQGSGEVKTFDEKGNPDGHETCPKCGGTGKN